jgi:hypothetical protein
MYKPVVPKIKAAHVRGSDMGDVYTKAQRYLCKQQIVSARWMPKAVYESHGWTVGPIMLTLSNGIMVYSCDEEFDGGAVKTDRSKTPAILPLQDGISPTFWKKWKLVASDVLVGKTIESVYFLSEEELQKLQWDRGSMCLQLNSKTLLLPASTDGSAPGVWIYHGTTSGVTAAEIHGRIPTFKE